VLFARSRAWPAGETLSRLGIPRTRLVLDAVFLAGLGSWAIHSAYSSDVYRGALAAVPALALLLCLAAACRYHRTTIGNRLGVSLGLLALLAGVGWAAYATGAHVAAAVMWITVSSLALERLPQLYALATAVLMAVSFGLMLRGTGPLTLFLSLAGVLLGGYVLRLDAEARGAGFRLLAQERAAREAEAVSVALAERARIAREIHDVLAHSLSAQLVHLEAARIQIERTPESELRDTLLVRVTDARRMARQGLAETRQALSALRGELVPVDDYLVQLAAEDGADARFTGEPRPLGAEASQAVRRVAQEALTNARKHAPGGAVSMLLVYEDDRVTLEVSNRAGQGHHELAASGAGYGLLGMRERAELLGGTLEAGPEGEGFRVRLRVPA
jgi:signal transduction histidine kinase